MKTNDKINKKYASFNRRMMAATLDSFFAVLTIAPIVDFLTTKFMTVPEITTEQLVAMQGNPEMIANLLVTALPIWLAQSFVFFLASAICWKLWSSTPGKMLLGMKIVDADSEEKISDKQILLRCLGYIPSGALLFMGIFWIGIDKRRQGWHDKIANTVVIKK